MVLGLIIGVYTIATLAKLGGTQTKARVLGTGEGDVEAWAWEPPPSSRGQGAAVIGSGGGRQPSQEGRGSTVQQHTRPGRKGDAEDGLAGGQDRGAAGAAGAASGAAPGTRAPGQAAAVADGAAGARGGAVAAGAQQPSGEAGGPDPAAPGAQDRQSTERAGSVAPQAVGSKGLYSLSAVDLEGKERQLSEFAGKITMVINVASFCGYTNENYKSLKLVYDKYHAHGFEVLAFPCNQFGNQEPGSAAEIREFCTSKYNVNWPVFAKVDVNGPNAHPVYQFLKRHLPVSEGGGGGESEGKDLVWNFQKFLVDRNGRPVKLHTQKFDMAEIERDVYNLLLGNRVS